MGSSPFIRTNESTLLGAFFVGADEVLIGFNGSREQSMIATQNDYATEEGNARFHRVTQTSRQCRQPMSLLVLSNFFVPCPTRSLL